MKNKLIIPSLLLSAAILTGAGLTMANAQFGSPEQREAVETALEAGDYTAWQEAVNNMPRITDYVTDQASFETLQAMHEARENGDFDTVKALAEELGLPAGMMMGRRGGDQGPHGMNEEARAAIEAGDYDAWLEATDEDNPIRNHVASSEDFQTLTELHTAKQNGDEETARSLAEELGLPERGEMRGKRMGQE